MNKFVITLLSSAMAFSSGCDSGSSSSDNGHGHEHEPPGGATDAPVTATSFAGAQCQAGQAGAFPCNRIDLAAGMTFSVEGSDLWGWHDELNGQDYALVGLATGTAIVRVTVPSTPEYIAFVPSAGIEAIHRDIKIYDHYALVVGESPGHGMQVIDLSQVNEIAELTELSPKTRYTEFGSAHNLAVNTDTGFAYAVGTQTCNGGLHMIDVRDPVAPSFAGCFASAGYTHDAQCVTYSGADLDYLGHEICFAANEDTLAIVDVSDKTAPVLIANVDYPGVSYTHQGWLTEDQRYFFLGDELDEINYGHNTRTYLWDLADLEQPQHTYAYTSDTPAIDHNLYVFGDHVYQANYLAGVRILRMGNLALGEMKEVAFFDTVPTTDIAEFAGVWSVYPYFNDDKIITMNTNGEFFVLTSRLNDAPRCSDGLDNDADGATDYPTDDGCSNAEAQAEE